MIGDSGSRLCFLDLGLRAVELAHLHQVRRVPLMRRRVFRIEFQRLLKITLGAEPVPIEESLTNARDVYAPRVSDPHRLLSARRLSLWHLLDGFRDADVAQQRIGVGETGKRERERRVFLFGAFEKLDAVAKPFFVAFVPEVAAL